MINTGLKIQECRIRKGLTQAELAARAGVAQANLSNIEKGKRDLTVSMLIRLAGALEIRPSELIDEQAEEKRFALTRADIEKLAEVIVAPETRAASEIHEIAVFFRLLRPGAARRESSQKIQQAWASLRRRFTSAEIRDVFRRVEDAEQRVHA